MVEKADREQEHAKKSATTPSAPATPSANTPSIFGMLGESIELTVRGNTRDSYVYGALAAAKFLMEKPAGLFTMAEVLGID